jgi:hypothetical protein
MAFQKELGARRGRQPAVAIVLVITVAACSGGSADDTLRCGTGTVEVAGECRPMAIDAAVDDAQIGSTTVLDAITSGSMADQVFAEGTTTDSPQQGADGGINEAGWDGPMDCPAPLHGSPMVKVPNPSGVGFFCIDKTEVSQAQYQEFLDVYPVSRDPAHEQGPGCETNYLYSPKDNLGSGFDNTCQKPLTSFDPVKTPNDEVTCVDYCDALAYCTFAGKHLCRDLGPSDTLGYVNQWYYACQAGALSHIQAIDPDRLEWIDQCDQRGSCTIKRAACSGATAAQRNGISVHLGFRCCAL